MRSLQQLQELSYEDIRILMAVELGMRKFRNVPVNHIKFISRYNKEETQFYLDHSHKIGVLIRSSKGKIGYQLNSEGYDVLALHALFEKKILSSLGPSLGRGKESDVYRGLTPDGEQVAVKFHRLGQTSFRNIRKYRSYIQDRRHISWLYINRLSATQEFKALEMIHDLRLNTPIPIAHNRHVVVMSIFQGEEIHRFDELNDPIGHLDEIIRQYKIFFSQKHMIHADLGEFNILIDPDDNVMIIDWPQFEDWNHPQGKVLVTRDISNLCGFFRRKYGIDSDVTEIIEDILNLNPDYESNIREIEKE